MLTLIVEKEMDRLIHQHLIMKIEMTEAPAYLDDPLFWQDFIDTMITGPLGMVIAIPARAVLVSDPDNYGVTGSANLTTSHISWHVWSQDDPVVVQLDVYSCKCFDADALMDWIAKILDRKLISNIRYSLVDRADNTWYNISKTFEREHD
jgi:S-adenosylmethionine/arginine decarboxylase-like enzyme